MASKRKTIEPTDRTYTLREVPEHELAALYKVTERIARRAWQAGKLHGARPGGLIVLVTGADIENWLSSTRSDADN